MIFIFRGAEPLELAVVRQKNLNRLRALCRQPVSDDIKGYDIVAEKLWEAQYAKCCYCEVSIPCPYNDVEHFRPKAKAERSPGCNSNHGYWWLAYTWENMLFSCPSCNRSSKNTKFPLAVGSTSLTAENDAPGNEQPLLINPAEINPTSLIGYVEVKNSLNPNIKRWRAISIGNSVLAKQSIEIYGLNEIDRVEMRDRHYERQLKRKIFTLRRAVEANDIEKIKSQYEDFEEMFSAKQPHALFSFSVFSEKFSDVDFKNFGVKPLRRESVGLFSAWIPNHEAV